MLQIVRGARGAPRDKDAQRQKLHHPVGRKSHTEANILAALKDRDGRETLDEGKEAIVDGKIHCRHILPTSTISTPTRLFWFDNNGDFLHISHSYQT